jgi:hypothetical protein
MHLPCRAKMFSHAVLPFLPIMLPKRYISRNRKLVTTPLCVASSSCIARPGYFITIKPYRSPFTTRGSIAPIKPCDNLIDHSPAFRVTVESLFFWYRCGLQRKSRRVCLRAACTFRLVSMPASWTISPMRELRQWHVTDWRPNMRCGSQIFSGLNRQHTSCGRCELAVS